MRNIVKYMIVLAVATLTALPQQALAQHYVGVRGGVGSGWARYYPIKDKGTVWGLPNAGVSWKYYSDEAFFGGVEVDVIAMQQAIKYFEPDILQQFGVPGVDSSAYYRRTVNSIMMPIMWQPHIYMFNQRTRIFVNAGMTISYNATSHEKYASKEHGTVISRKYEMIRVRDNRWGYGLCVGGGFSWIRKRVELFGEFRYYVGYADILRNRNKYELNPLRSPLDGMQISVGAFIRLGKGEILSPQGKRIPGQESRRRRSAESIASPGFRK